MKLDYTAVGMFTVCLMLSALAPAQADAQPTTTVPRLIRITGSVRDEAGKPLSGNCGVTFTLYQDQGGQLPVWQETQNVQLDSSGRYNALLGATSEAGLPLEIFSSGNARWLGVRPDGQEEQPRILFVSVAYALKAADTEMLGGRPASAYLLAGGQNLATHWPAASAASDTASTTLPLLVSPQTACSAVTSDGTATANQVAKFTTACNIENSAIFESGGNVGIGNTTPAGTLDVSGTEVVRGALSLTPTGTATTSQGYISNPLQIEASVYNSGLSEPVTYVFQWQAEPEGNDSGATSSSLNLLWGSGSGIDETGLSIAKSGIVTFASGQTFPGTGSGTVTSVATGAGLTGGPITTSGTISIPSAGVTNAMLANDSLTVKAGTGLSGGGTVVLGGSVSLGENLSGTTDGMAYFSNPASVVSTAAPTNGQILIGSSGKAPVLGTLTAGSNISITNGPGSITISASGGGGAPTLPFFTTGTGHTGASQATTANVTKLWGILLPYNVTSTEIIYDVTTADKSSNNYDVGLFDNSGNLVVNLGATPGTTFSSSTGFKTLAWTQGSTSLAAGRYYFAITTNCASACAKIAAGPAAISFAVNASAGSTTGGGLPTSITPPADSWSSGNQPAVVIQ